MCPPTMYDVNYVINPWMEGNLNRSSIQDATRQWEQLYTELARVARVELVEQQAGSPDMVFTANAGLVCDGMVALSRFLHPERQGEEPHFRKWFDDSGFTVRELPRTIPFEGEGDALFEADNSRLWAGHGMRSRESSHQDSAGNVGRRGDFAAADRSSLLPSRHVLLSALWRIRSLLSGSV